MQNGRLLICNLSCFAAVVGNKQHSLLFATLASMKGACFAPVVPRLFLILFTYSQPLLLQRMVDYLTGAGNQSKQLGWALVGAYAIVYLGIAVRELYALH